LLTGEPLFNGKTYQEVLSKNMACNLVFPDILWNNVSSLARSLVQSMLEKDPNKRYSALDCLNHEWIKNEAITPMAPLPGAIENLKKYCIR
jgi:serine/threonine protein kinase